MEQEKVVRKPVILAKRSPRTQFTLNATKCCAVAEIDNLGTCKSAEDALLWFMQEITILKSCPNYYPPYITFVSAMMTIAGETYARTHNVKCPKEHTDYGQEFVDLINKEKLGVVIELPAKVNPITGNSLRFWIWNPDYTKIIPKMVGLGLLYEYNPGYGNIMYMNNTTLPPVEAKVEETGFVVGSMDGTPTVNRG